MTEPITYAALNTGDEFPPASFSLDSERAGAYLGAVEDDNRIYREQEIVPPMAVAALAMTALSESLVLPAGTIHVSQEMVFRSVAGTGETLSSYTKVNRKVARGKFHMLSIGISVRNQQNQEVLTGEAGFILPVAGEEEKP